MNAMVMLGALCLLAGLAGSAQATTPALDGVGIAVCEDTGDTCGCPQDPLNYAFNPIGYVNKCLSAMSSTQ